jgi:hypothetical protein
MQDSTMESGQTLDLQMELGYVADPKVTQRKTLALRTKPSTRPGEAEINITTLGHKLRGVRTWLNVVQCAQFRSSMS